MGASELTLRQQRRQLIQPRLGKVGREPVHLYHAAFQTGCRGARAGGGKAIHRDNFGGCG